MQTAYYYQLAQAERTHWWYTYRSQLMDDFLTEMHPQRFTSALDVGCGTGGNFAFLRHHADRLTGFDLSDDALKLARQKDADVQLVKGNVNEITQAFPDQQFDLIMLSSVLYHQWIQSEQAVLTQLYDKLMPGGVLILVEAAFPVLMRHHDDVVMGRTRYRIAPLKSLVEGAGFTTHRASYFNAISFPPCLLLAWMDRLRSQKKQTATQDTEQKDKPSELLDLQSTAWVDRFVLALLSIERWIIRRFRRFPFGVNLLLLAQRPKS
ncbi:class I SAM-dependent DNA methyltransferase [Magnetococcales bacterium HHB-1]